MSAIRRIGITLGGGYVPGLGGVVRAITLAAQRRGWEVLGIRDGFDGLLFPDRYQDAGLVGLDQVLFGEQGSLLGTGVRHDPFRLQQMNDDGLVEDRDASGDVLAALRGHRIDAVIGIVGGSAATGSHALTVMWKLARQGLHCVCIPKSVENDLAATAQPYGYDSVLTCATQTLHHACIAAHDQGRVALVEVPGQLAGWLALDAGLAAGADAILIPEFAYDPAVLAQHVDGRDGAALIVVSEGAHSLETVEAAHGEVDSLRTSLSPLSDPEYGSGMQVIHRAGRAARRVCEDLQRRSCREFMPLPLDQLVRAGPVSARDRILGPAYGIAAVQALADGEVQHLVVARADRFETMPLAEAVNRVRTVDTATPACSCAAALGIYTGGHT